MLNLLIRWVLTPLNKLMNKLPWKFRDFMFLVGGIGVIGHSFLNNMNLVNYRFLYFFAISCVFLGLMILGGMGTEVKPVRFNRFLSICWFGVGVMMLQSGIRNNIDYLPEAMLLLVAYPVLYICWSNGDRQRIFRLLLALCRISGWIFALGSFLLAQIIPARYAGIFTNTNMAAYTLAVIFAGITMHILYTPFSWKQAPDILLLGIIVALNYYTNSRTGTLSILLVTVASLGMYALTHKWKDTVKCVPKLAACAAASLICASSLVFVFQLRMYLPLPYLDLTTGTLYYLPPPDQGNTPPDSTTPGDTADPTQPLDSTQPPDPTQPTFFDTHEFDDLNDIKTDHSNKTLDQYSTGRLSIWKAYASNLNLLGHASTEPIYVDMLYKNIRSTHMTILQVAYDSGIIAGVLYLLLNLGTGIGGIWFAWNHRKEPYALVPLMFTLVFGVLSVLGSCGVSFWYPTTFFYYLVLFPIITSLPEQKRA